MCTATDVRNEHGLIKVEPFITARFSPDHPSLHCAPLLEAASLQPLEIRSGHPALATIIQ